MIKKILNSRFKKDLSFSYITQLLTISFGFIQLFLINRYFGIDIYGQIAIIVASAGIFSSLLTARSSEAITRFFRREELNKNFSNAKFILYIGFIVDFITGCLLVIGIYFLSEFISSTFLKSDSFSEEVVLYSFITFIIFLRGTINGYLQAQEMFIEMNKITISELLLKIFLLLFFIFVLDMKSLKDAILIFLIASIGSYFYAFVVFIKSYSLKYKEVFFKYNKTILKEYWSFNLKTFFSSTLKAGNQNVDNLILAYFFNAQIVGIYQIIKKILSPVSMISKPFTTLVYTKLINYYENNQKSKFKNIILKISFYIILTSVLYVTLAIVFIDDIFYLLNIEFLSEYLISLVIISCITIIGAQMWWTRIFSNTVNPNYSIYVNLFATLYQLIITVFISKYFGFEGMLYSILIMQILIYSYLLKKVYDYVSN